MSDRDLYLSGGNPWTYGLSALLFCLALVAFCWVALHAGPYLLHRPPSWPRLPAADAPRTTPPQHPPPPQLQEPDP